MFLFAPTLHPNAYLHTATLVKTSGWDGTRITRTDANGTAPVRTAPGQDTTGTTGSATMTVTDYELALTGTATYTVTDGHGATATVVLTPGFTPATAATTGVWLTAPALANPATPARAPVRAGHHDHRVHRGTRRDRHRPHHHRPGRPAGEPGPAGVAHRHHHPVCVDYPAAHATVRASWPVVT